MAHGVIVMA